MAPIPNPPPTSTSSRSVEQGASKLSRWIDENRGMAIALGLGTLALGGGAAYYLLAGRASAPGPSSPPATSEKKKKKSGKKGKKNGSGAAVPPSDGPILEEADDESLMRLSEDEIRKLPEERRKTLAQTLKAAGNKAYSSRQFDEAINYYTKAIAAHPLAVFYSNRAACYSNLGRPADVIPDCDKALSMDKAYVKALNRRAVAREQIGGDASEPGEEGEQARQTLFQSLVDFTAVGILGQFKDQNAIESVERVLKKIASSKAKEILRTREPKLPSPTFVTAYLEAFRPKPTPKIADDAQGGDNALKLAYGALAARNYPHAFSLFNEAIEQGLSNEDLEAAALNMRGTFRFVIGDARSALEDLERSTTLRPDFVQSWVKKASVHMELGDKDEAFRDFDVAIKSNAEDPDIYYHRGQVHFILGEYEAAIEDYERSTSLDENFIFSQVQFAVAQYKTGNIGKSTACFRKLLRTFDGSSEAFNYYGELLLDQQKYEDALANFDKAIEIEAKKPQSSNVLPMINKALALFQWKQDMAGAEALCRQALAKDPDCDTAVATLAQLSLQQGKIVEAIEFFERSAGIARTSQELENAITYENASRAQLQFIKDYPEEGKALSRLAAGL